MLIDTTELSILIQSHIATRKQKVLCQLSPKVLIGFRGIWHAVEIVHWLIKQGRLLEGVGRGGGEKNPSCKDGEYDRLNICFFS